MKKTIFSIMFLGAVFLMTDSTYGAMNCPETPGPNEVLLFTEENFQGKCTSYIGFNREIRRHKSPVRSVKVGSGIEVRLCRRSRFKGRCRYEKDAEIAVFDPEEMQGNWRSLSTRKRQT